MTESDPDDTLNRLLSFYHMGRELPEGTNERRLAELIIEQPEHLSIDEGYPYPLCGAIKIIDDHMRSSYPQWIESIRQNHPLCFLSSLMQFDNDDIDKLGLAEYLEELCHKYPDYIGSSYALSLAESSALLAKMICIYHPHAASKRVLELIDGHYGIKFKYFLDFLSEPSEELLATISARSSDTIHRGDKDPRTADIHYLMPPKVTSLQFTTRHEETLRAQITALCIARSFQRHRTYGGAAELHEVEVLWSEKTDLLLPIVRDYVEIASQTDEDLLTPLVIAASSHEGLRTRIEEIAKSGKVGRKLASQLRGISLFAGGTDKPDDRYDALSAIASWTKFRDQPPSPLAAPSSTWLTDAGVEAILRSAVTDAERQVRTWPGRAKANEETLTAGLSALVRRALGVETAELKKRGVILSVDDYAPSKNAETLIGADVALHVTVDAARWIRGEWATFIQVKKDNEKKKYPTWSIDENQLQTILRIDPTSSYWLFDRLGVVHVVPSKFLQLIRGSRPNRKKIGGSPKFLVNFQEIRSAAIKLDGFFVDLLTGAWLGQSDDESLSIAKLDSQELAVKRTLRVKLQVGKVDLDDRWLQ